MALPPDYIAALEALAGAFASYRRLTGREAVLVGGSAVAVAVSGIFMSGDFDVVAANDPAFEAAMLENGFRKEDQEGFLRMGFYHPEHPAYGFQQVSGALFDGKSDSRKALRISVSSGTVTLPAIEDLIADRLGQYAAGAPSSDDSRLQQALIMFSLAESLDVDYLLRRISDEGGDPALLGLDPGADGNGNDLTEIPSSG